MTSILGISAFYHDSAASIIVDGQIIAAAQEERFSRIKHDSSYPKNAVEFVLNYSNLSLSQVESCQTLSAQAPTGKIAASVFCEITAR